MDNPNIGLARQSNRIARRMSKTIHSERHRRLVEILVERRKAAGLSQAAVAREMGRHQPFIANIESGDRRVDLVELIDLADILGFDVHEIIDELTINK